MTVFSASHLQHVFWHHETNIAQEIVFIQEHIPVEIAVRPLILSQIFISHNCNQHFFSKAFTLAMIYAFSLLQGHFYLYMSLGISDIKVLTVKGCTTDSLISVQLLQC